jgi:Cys-rich protein (TIGR01571 family)
MVQSIFIRTEHQTMQQDPPKQDATRATPFEYTRSWRVGIFDCTNESLQINLCSFLPLTVPFVMTNIAARVRHYPCRLGFMGLLSFTLLLGYANYGTSVALSYVSGNLTRMILVLVGSIATGCLYVLLYDLRLRVRALLQIAGDLFSDMALTLCCSCCSLVQMSREVELREISLCEEPAPYAINVI